MVPIELDEAASHLLPDLLQSNPTTPPAERLDE
jgi:hypothetical protein